MNWIDLYINEVGRHLPTKNRADIEAELRSTLQDMLDERSQKTSKPVDEDMILDVLKTYGDPQKVAATYMPEAYLIGPSLFPTYLTLCKAMLYLTGIVVLIALIVGLVQSAHDVTSASILIGKSISSFFDGAFSTLGSITLIFGLIEWGVRRSGERIQMKGLPELRQWDPRRLAKTRPHDRIKIGSLITDIAFSFLAIYLFNFYRQAFSVGVSTSGGWYIGTGAWASVPLFSQAFYNYVPVLTIIWGVGILLYCFLLFQGAWNPYTRLVSIGLKIANIAVAFAMLHGPSMLAVSAANLPAGLTSTVAIQMISTILPIIVTACLWMAVVFGIVDVIERSVKLIRSWVDA